MNKKIQLKTPITYYGGKQKMLGTILPLIPEHKIYTEAFFGGGAVFWAKQPTRVEFINDHNAEVINFYRVLKNDFAALKREIDATLHSEGMQKEAKAIYRNPCVGAVDTVSPVVLFDFGQYVEMQQKQVIRGSDTGSERCVHGGVFAKA